MRIQPAVREETKKIALGTAALMAVMLLVFLLIGEMTQPVLLGALLGFAVAVGNFFLMALSVQKAAGKMNGAEVPPEEETEAGGEDAKTPLSPEARQARQGMRLSYIARMLLIAGSVIAAVKLPCFHPAAAVIPLFFPRIVIAFMGIWMKKKDKQA